MISNLHITLSRNIVWPMNIPAANNKTGIKRLECIAVVDPFFSVRHSFEDEPSNERIPCEFCDTLINVDDWNSHSVNIRSFRDSISSNNIIVENLW